jgi:hypothetical protein
LVGRRLPMLRISGVSIPALGFVFLLAGLGGRNLFSNQSLLA